MAATEREISNIFEWLKTTKHVSVSVEWLEACISWLKSRSSAQGNLNMELRNGVYEQWLLSDLMESGAKSLPDNITTLAKTIIPRIITLQMNGIINVGESAYSQLKKHTKANETEDSSNEDRNNQRWQARPCRMLMLELTDGEQAIQGMEYQAMKKLHSDIKPGTKILIKANTLCRSGMLFLTDNNVEILGGQVQSLMEENSQMNILNRLVTNAKESGNGIANPESTNERLQNNGVATQSNNRGNNNHGSMDQGELKRSTQLKGKSVNRVTIDHRNVCPLQKRAIQHVENDCEAMMSEDDEFLAALDDNFNTDELTLSTQRSTQPFHGIDDDLPDEVLDIVNDLDPSLHTIDDDIPDEVLNNLDDIEHRAVQEVSEDVLVRSLNKAEEQWQFDDDDDFW